MRILAVLQYKISYHINYIATGSGVFCDSDLVYQKSQLCTDISGGVRDNLAQIIVVSQPSTKMPSKMTPENPWCHSLCASGQEVRDLQGTRNDQFWEMSCSSQK